MNPAPAEIIIVADGDEAVCAPAERIGARVVRLTQSGGPARARNAGAQAATGDIFYFVDSDVTVAVDAISTIRSAFEADPQLAGMIGSYDDEPAERNLLSQYKNLQHHFVHQNGGDEAFTFWGACGAIRREPFFAVHGFDEKYAKPSIEDIELGYRLRAAGYRLRLLKTLQVKHLKHWGPVNLFTTDFFGRALPWSKLIVSHRKMANDLNIDRAARFSVIFVGLMLIGIAGAILFRSVYWLAIPIVCAAALTMLNLHFYRFLARKRGVAFTIACLPWHWFHYFYGGVAFAIATASSIFSRPDSTQSNKQPTDTEAAKEKSPLAI